MSEPNKSLRTIFAEALEIADAQKRDVYLSKACGGNLALRREVEELILAEGATGTFLPEKPATDAARAVLVGASEALGLGPVTLKFSTTAVTGECIGRYKLLQQIGEGGCGVVYMAEQQEPVRRRVALKVIKLGMDTKQVIARFDAERQALALMDHPHIAKVLDGGATDAGRPYFVMELVKGIPITRYCDENKLDTRQRLDLFIQVCLAVQHAHQKGIIHRDIKPSNLLVADHDGVPVPKVIDFGIAKATAGQTLTDKTLFTAFEQFVGTPAYISPEQAKLSGLDIDTRSDIYSLGVLLYELLTSKPPFDAKRLVEAGLEEICRIIREEEPLLPSTKLSTLDLEEQTTVARQRKSEPPKLAGLIRGDLDWIVMTTLEKDRNRRYETANGLAMDLQRFLNEEPIAARPPSNLYRFKKLVRRNKLAFVATSAVSAALIAGFCVSMWLFAKEKQALHRADAAENRILLESVKFTVLNAQTDLIESTHRHLTSLTHFPQILASNVSSFGPFFATITKLYKDYIDFGLIEKNGDVVSCSLGSNSPVNIADRSWFQRVLQSQNFAIGKFQKGEGTNKPTLPIGEPVLNKAELTRVIYGALDLDAFNRILSRAAVNAKLRPGCVIRTLDRDGRILASYPEPEKWVGKPFAESNIVARMITEEEGSAEMRGLDGVSRLYIFTSSRNGLDISFFVVVGVPTSPTFVEIKRR